jgi:hypothetical protein
LTAKMKSVALFISVALSGTTGNGVTCKYSKSGIMFL